MASQQPEVTVVAEGDDPLLAYHPSTGQDVPVDSAQQRSEETSDMPQTVENGESIYKSTLCHSFSEKSISTAITKHCPVPVFDRLQ